MPPRLLVALIVSSSLTAIGLCAGAKEFTRIGVEHGLSTSWVRAVVQDSYGFVWAGTKDGLNRYDGREFRVYRADSEDARGLANTSINELVMDSESRLWVGTLSGAYLYNRKLDRFEQFEPIGDVTVNSIAEASDGTFWFGTPNELFHYFPETSELRSYTHDPLAPSSLISNVVWEVSEDSSGRLWIGTEEGLCYYDARRDGFSRFDDAEAVGRTAIASIAEDKWGRVWIGSEEALFIYDLRTPNGRTMTEILSLPILCVEFDESGSAWLGHGSGQGLTYIELDPGTGEILEVERHFNRMHDAHSLSADGVQVTYADRSGGIWVGTYSNGLSYYSSSRKRFTSVKIQHASSDFDVGEQVDSIFVDSSEYWVGTEKGLVRFDYETETFHQYKYDENDSNTIGANAVYSIIKDARDDIWVGCWGGGLNRYDRESDSFVRYLNDPQDDMSLSNDNVFCIFEDSSQILWVGTIGGGLNRYNRDTDTFERFSHDPDDPNTLNSQFINDIAQDSEGALWLSTYSGLDRYDPQKGTFEHFSHTGDPFSQNQGDLEVVFIDSREQIWLGTEVGLVFFDRRRELYLRYGARDGLPNSVVKSISEDGEGNLWIATNDGLSKFANAVHRPSHPQFLNFSTSDGLQGSEFVKRASFVAADGEIWIGGVSGLTRFYPDQIVPDTQMPPVLITDLSILNRKVFPAEVDSVLPAEPYLLDTLALDYKDSVFSFRFTSILYPRSHDVEYAYMLEGFDNEWQYVNTSTSAIYTNIDPGAYVFRVKSSNSNGIWGDNVTSLRVAIAPPWWNTLWFRTVWAGLFILLLFGGYTWRVYALNRSRERLAFKVAERTRELGLAKAELATQNAELKDHRANLEQLVKERTEELEKERDKAKVSDRLKSAFIGNMSHEIRTPLNAIMGFSQLIAMEAQGKGEFDKYSDCIRENSEMLLQLLNDIIDFSILEAEKLQLHSEAIDAWIFFQELSTDIDHLVASRTPENVTYLAENGLLDTIGILFLSDKVRLRQILLNIATNACKFTEEGHIAFGVALSCSNRELKFWIKDTGVGIAAEEQDAVFERFHKIVDETKTFARGTGLGLAICKRLSEELGYALTLESEVGRGSVFTLTIPVESEKGAELRVRPRSAHSKAIDLDLTGRVILVAEDIQDNYIIVERFLSETGAQLIHALDGRKALQAFKERKGAVDLLLLDISMPNMGGVDALKAMRSLDPDVPAIALTAHAFRKDLDALLDVGFQSCITKPVERAVLVNTIAGLLNRAKT